MAVEVVGKAEHKVLADIENVKILIKINSGSIEDGIRFGNTFIEGIKTIVQQYAGTKFSVGTAYFVDNQLGTSKIWPKTKRYVSIPVYIAFKINSELEAKLIQFSSENLAPDRCAFSLSASFDLSKDLYEKELRAVTREAVSDGFSRAELIISALSKQPASIYFPTPCKQLKLIAVYSDGGVSPRIMKAARVQDSSDSYSLHRDPAEIPVEVSLRMSFDII